MRLDRRIGWAGVATLGLLGGCQDLNPRPKEHASSTFLDSGPQVRLSKRQMADVQVSMGRTAEEQGQFDQARSAYLSALERDPKRADAELRLAILDDRKGDEAGTERHFARALSLRPKDPEILCDQGYSRYLRRRWGDAEFSLKQALKIDPSHARSHTNLGLVLARQGDDSGALAEFARAGLDPADARSNLGLILALEGRFEESKREYALALAAKPTSNRAKEGLAAATVALNAKSDLRSIAANGQAKPGVDPALVRTSVAPSGR